MVSPSQAVVAPLTTTGVSATTTKVAVPLQFKSALKYSQTMVMVSCIWAFITISFG